MLTLQKSSHSNSLMILKYTFCIWCISLIFLLESLQRIEHEISANENSYEDVLKKGNTILGNNNGGYTESVREKLDYLQSR